MKLLHSCHKCRAQQKGVAAIEFAIVLPLLVLIFTGMVEYGRLMWHYDVLAKATRDAARYLSTVPTASLAGEADTPTSTTRNIVANAATAAGVSINGLNPLTYIPITCQDSGGTDVSCATGTVSRVKVAVNYPFSIGGWVPVIGLGSGINDVTLSPHTTMPYMR